MKHLLLTTLIAGGLISSAAVNQVHAQDTNENSPRLKMFERLDTDNNGSISKEEFLNRPQPASAPAATPLTEEQKAERKKRREERLKKMEAAQ